MSSASPGFTPHKSFLYLTQLRIMTNDLKPAVKIHRLLSAHHIKHSSFKKILQAHDIYILHCRPRVRNISWCIYKLCIVSSLKSSWNVEKESIKFTHPNYGTERNQQILDFYILSRVYIRSSQFSRLPIFCSTQILMIERTCLYLISLSSN